MIFKVQHTSMRAASAVAYASIITQLQGFLYWYMKAIDSENNELGDALREALQPGECDGRLERDKRVAWGKNISDLWDVPAGRPVNK
jgi:hypothetical protein